MKTKIKSVWMNVTPAKARVWLDKNKINRRVRDGALTRLIRDMEEGNYRETHQGIAFDVNGILLDGQHRLMAIEASGVTVRMLVTTGLQPEARDVIDVGETRTLGDAIGFNQLNGEYSQRTMQTVAIAMRNGGGNQHVKMTQPEGIAFVKKYSDSIKWTIEKFSRRGVAAKSVVMAVVARAYHNKVPRKKLERFCEVLNTELPNGDPTETTIMRLLRLLRAPGMTTTNRQGRRVTYLKTQRALEAYLAGEELQVLKPAENNKYPLPEDVKDVKGVACS